MIFQLLLLVLLLWVFGYICYQRGRQIGIREGRIDEQQFMARHTTKYLRDEGWIGYN